MPINRSAAAEGITIEAIVEKALELIECGGLADLTLRPLALKLGVSVPVISARMGTKEQLIERVVEAAHTIDRTFYDKWLRVARGIKKKSPAVRAAMTAQALRDWLNCSRDQVLSVIEMVHDRALRPDRCAELEC